MALTAPRRAPTAAREPAPVSCDGGAAVPAERWPRQWRAAQGPWGCAPGGICPEALRLALGPSRSPPHAPEHGASGGGSLCGVAWALRIYGARRAFGPWVPWRGFS